MLSSVVPGTEDQDEDENEENTGGSEADRKL